jgi:hypothetical protein
VLDEHRRWAGQRVFGVPTLLIGDGGMGSGDGGIGNGDRAQHVVFGPVLRTLPSDEDGIVLWRHLRGLAVLGTVFELKRFKSLQSRADLPNAVPRANLRVADMRAARALMGPGGPCEGDSLEWAMGRVRAQRAAASAPSAASTPSAAADSSASSTPMALSAPAAPSAGEGA